ncbi:hypothetical protein RI367_001410 [Sorochytrium milnesiophthora]
MARNILLFIHGFLGSEQSFGQLPAHLEARLSPSSTAHADLTTFEALVFPSFTCEHSLADAAVSVKDYLYNLADAQPVNVILLAHSMGGIIAADAAHLIRTRTVVYDNASSTIQAHPEAPRNPIKVIGIIAYDSPFFSLNPKLLNTIHRPLANTVSTILSQPLWISVSTAVAAVGAGVYASRELSRYSEFLAPLINETSTQRVDRIRDLLRADIEFRCYYPQLPDIAPSIEREINTFIRIPNDLPDQVRSLFRPLRTSELSSAKAHMAMFSPAENPLGYADLLEDTVHDIEYWMAKVGDPDDVLPDL